MTSAVTLSFRPDLVGPILSEAKRQTYRRSRPVFGVDDLVYGTCRRKRFCLLKITSVRLCVFEDLTDHDAMWDGYKSLDHLVTELRKTYPAVEEAWRIGFRLEDVVESPRSSARDLLP
jgi:hypothetical protein